MRLIPPLQTFANGYGRKVPVRSPAQHPIPFQELIPLKLKDKVSAKRDNIGGMYGVFTPL